MEAMAPRPAPLGAAETIGEVSRVRHPLVVDRTELVSNGEDLFPPTVEQRRQRIVALIEDIAPLVASLSEELCKEDHGRFMATGAKVEEAAIIIEANLTELEAAATNEDTPARPTRLVRFLALFWARAEEMVKGYAALSRKRDRQLETVNRLRTQVRELRERPAKLQAGAVLHVKRLLLYADPRYRQMNETLTYQARDLEREASNSYYSKKTEALRQSVGALKQQMEMLDGEFLDKALLQVQESDNGKKPVT